jgi:hypothetical protein
MNYKQLGKIKVSREWKEDILHKLDMDFQDIADNNYAKPKLHPADPCYDDVLDLNDMYRKIQVQDYLIEQLQKIKIKRIKEANKLLKRIKKK